MIHTSTYTKDLLARELRKVGLDKMADKAEGGYYHHFLSPLAAPALQLANDLGRVGTPEARALRDRLIAGEFDATRQEAEEWMQSPEGQAAAEALVKYPGA